MMSGKCFLFHAIRTRVSVSLRASNLPLNTMIEGTIFGAMGGTETTFDFLAELPQREEDWSSELVAEVKAYKDDWKEQGGLLTGVACPPLLGVSKQRFHQLATEYDFWNKTHLGQKFYSFNQLFAFYKVRRKQGKAGSDTAEVLKSLLKQGA